MSKPKAPYRKTEIAGRKLSPETMMMSYGYSPQLSEWSIKAPVFLTSTFAFESAEAGAAFFRVMGGRRQEGGARPRECCVPRRTTPHASPRIVTSRRCGRIRPSRARPSPCAPSSSVA